MNQFPSVFSLETGLIFLWCNPPCNLEVPFWGSPLQLSSQPWRQSMVCARGMEWDGNQESVIKQSRAQPGNLWISYFHKAAEPVACLHRGFTECLGSGFMHPLADPWVPTLLGSVQQGRVGGSPSPCPRVIWQGRCQQMLIFRCPGMAVSPLRPHSPRQQCCALSSLMCDPAACIILQGLNRRLKGRLCGHCFQYPSC